ncbi:MAG TPA: decarboxylating 6-phosphogluconate dehydrogenase [Nitriliruptorales bacterium]|nr:decarboxylating 6-phosphogluconate dehydrogenase [Nitriliruptorales bacterium]
MKLGMVGLGRMGGNMATRLRRHGHQVIGYDRDSEITQVGSLEGLVAALDGEPRRVVWLMLPAGDPTDLTIVALGELLDAGDLLVDGGNSNWRDSIAHARRLAQRGIDLVDAGVSGGVWGLEEGFCLMLGGADRDVADLRPVLDALATAGGHAHVGPVGAGHFAKMVHNGVEYALMEAYAEGYELLRATDLDIDVPAAVEVWRHGSVVRSWLLDLFADALAQDPDLDRVRGYAEDSGEGRWTVQTAVDLAVPVPAIAAALFARFASRQHDSPAMRVIAILRHRFGGHQVRP